MGGKIANRRRASAQQKTQCQSLCSCNIDPNSLLFVPHLFLIGCIQLLVLCTHSFKGQWTLWRSPTSVCVCARERKRGKEREWQRKSKWDVMGAPWQPVIACVCFSITASITGEELYLKSEYEMMMMTVMLQLIKLQFAHMLPDLCKLMLKFYFFIYCFRVLFRRTKHSECVNLDCRNFAIFQYLIGQLFLK